MELPQHLRRLLILYNDLIKRISLEVYLIVKYARKFLKTVKTLAKLLKCHVYIIFMKVASCHGWNFTTRVRHADLN